MPAEVVHSVFNCFLKSHHYKKRNNGSAQTNAYAGHRYFMDGGCKPIACFTANSSRYEIRKVQFSITFECVGQDNPLSILIKYVLTFSMRIKYGVTLLCVFILWCCTAANQPMEAEQGKNVMVGAAQLDVLLPLLEGKRVGLVVNHTSLVGKTHLADTLKSRGIDLVKIFGPEHGFRGTAADGQHVEDSIDYKTGVPVISLHGKNRKPTAEHMAAIDVVVFDIQDVGARFYTYISTMHYVMEACAENGKKLIILDRPNPNGSYVDGPVREPEFKYFLAMHPIPIVHGLTVGELAQMINGEKWLEGERVCDVAIITVKNWKHNDAYSLPVRPSPNLPNDQAIQLYPSLCLFEQTVISVGRGTSMQFQVLGNPLLKNFAFQFTPINMPGISNNPPHENKVCYGVDLRHVNVQRKLDLSYLIQFYTLYPDKEKFFLGYFDNLAGTKLLKQQIKEGLSEEQIRASWEPALSQYKELRKKYLLYP